MRKQTFIIEIMDHQKSTWQGQIFWVQENKQVSFRSVMELLYLMDSAVSADEEDGRCQEKERRDGK